MQTETLTQETLLINDLLNIVDGHRVEEQLISLAQIGGKPLEGDRYQQERYAVSRLALSSTEFEARKHIAKQMESAGMAITDGPLGLIGRYEGSDPNLPSILMLSHFDSVPNGGMYDGTVGVVSGIEAVRIFHENRITLRHPIMVLALTGEESSRFGISLFGSKGMFLGLTDGDLNHTNSKGESIRQSLEQAGYDPNTVKVPTLSNNEICASVEVHVEQNSRLEESGTDLAVIKSIAAPIRYKVAIGTPSIPEDPLGPDTRYFGIDMNGKSGHSGATPMGKEYRADGLVPQAELMIHLNTMQNAFIKNGMKIQISVGGISIEDESMNKIPGRTHLALRVSGENSDEINTAIESIHHFISVRNKTLSTSPTHFDANTQPINIHEEPDLTMPFFDANISLREYSLASYIIKAINSVATQKANRDENNVGTVGTLDSKDGQIMLQVDIRGINKVSRDEMTKKIEEIISVLETSPVVTGNQRITCRRETIPGGGDPTNLDAHLVKTAQDVIGEYGIGSSVVTFSPAGHDTQNVARGGIPTTMLFIPSRRRDTDNPGEYSHNPNEYSSPDDLKNGVKALMALVYRLAS